MEIIFVGGGGGGWRTQTQILMDFLRFVIFACPHKILLTRRIDKFSMIASRNNIGYVC